MVFSSGTNKQESIPAFSPSNGDIRNTVPLKEKRLTVSKDEEEKMKSVAAALHDSILAPVPEQDSEERHSEAGTKTFENLINSFANRLEQKTTERRYGLPISPTHKRKPNNGTLLNRLRSEPRLSSDIVSNTCPFYTEEVSDESANIHKIIPKYNAYVTHHHSESMRNVIPQCLPIISRQKKSMVLVTDDIFSNRMVVREMLKNIHAQSLEAINGEEAVKEVEKALHRDSLIEIALIFMDINMPVMNGVEATVAIRNLEKKYGRTTRIPIVALTAHDTTSDKKACSEAGMQEYVVKPINFKILVALARKYATSSIDKNLP